MLDLVIFQLYTTVLDNSLRFLVEILIMVYKVWKQLKSVSDQSRSQTDRWDEKQTPVAIVISEDYRTIQICTSE